MNEYEHEPIPGLPEELPEGEYILWQGVPEWSAMARRVFHVRAVGLYFALLVAWYLSARFSAGASPEELLAASTWPLALGASALAILVFMAWAFARSTIYTLTNRRIVLRFGVAIPMMINIPLDKLESADMALYGDDQGDICLTLAEGERISYMALWPHARPWHYGRVKPMLRSLHNPTLPAKLLAEVASEGADVKRAADTRPAPRPRHVVSTRPLVT